MDELLDAQLVMDIAELLIRVKPELYCKYAQLNKGKKTTLGHPT